MESGDPRTTTPSDEGVAKAGGSPDRAMPPAAHACLVLSILAGVGLLVWWSVVFHRNDEQLWMVPVSLVMVGTPLMVWLSVSRPSSCHPRSKLKLLFISRPESAVVLPDPDPEK